MSSYHGQALIEAPAERVWKLLGNPLRHPEWWPRVVEVRGDSFEVGDAYVQVTDAADGRDTTRFLVEEREEMKEIRLLCQKTGTYAHWRLTPAQGNTFVDVTFGIEPTSRIQEELDRPEKREYFMNWLDSSLKALQEALAKDSTPSGS